MKKRLLSLGLVFVMLLSLLPMSVFAAEAGFDNFKKVNEYKPDTFTDVTDKDWFAENVRAVYELGLMIGQSDNVFGAKGNVTVAETATVAARLHAIYTSGTENFTQSTPWYQVYVDYLTENKLFDLTGLDLSAPATRAQFAGILGSALPDEALKAINGIKDNAIPDVKQGDPYADTIYKLYRAGVLAGNDAKGTFLPETPIKRSEVAAIVTRMAQPDLRLDLPFGEKQDTGCKVTFDLNYPNGGVYQTVTVEKGKTVTLPAAPTRSGYNFSGWYTEATGGSKFDAKTAINEDLTLYARWSSGGGGGGGGGGASAPSMFTVTFNSNGGSTVLAQRVAVGSKATVPADPTKEGNRFVAWYRDPELNSLYDFESPVTSSITLYAKWEVLTPEVLTPLDEETNVVEIYSFSAQPYDLPYNEGGDVTFRAEIFSDCPLNDVRVIDENNNILGIMSDDDNDGIYTATITFPAQQKTNNLLCKAKFGDVESNSLTIGFYKEYTQEEMDSYDTIIALVNDVLNEYIDENGYLKNNSDYESAKEALLDCLDNNPSIEEIKTDDDSHTIKITLVSGAVYRYMLSDPGTDAASVYSFQPFKDTYSTFPTNLQRQSNVATDGSARRIDSTFDFYSFDSITSDDSMNTTEDDNYDSEEVSLSALKELHNCSVMAWHGHGGYYNDVGSFMGTGNTYSQSLYYAYTDDFDRSRIIVSNNRCWITGGFIEKYCQDMTGHFYYLGTCSSGRDMVDGHSNDFELAQAFINKGAAAVIANTSTISTNYNTKMEASVFSYLCSLDTNEQYYNLSDALERSKEEHGTVDPEEYEGRHAVVRIFPTNNSTASNYRLSETGTIAGSVKSASTDAPIASALIRVYNSNNSIVASARTDISGSYRISVAPGNYTVTVTAGAYKTVKMAVTVTENTTVYNETFLLIQNSIFDVGKANGMITSATTGSGVSDVTIKLRLNWNNYNGAVKYTTTTNSNGFYEISGVAGAYTMEYYKSGYSVGYKNILLLVDYAAQNAVISPVTSEGVYRIVLSWSNLPNDLDSHLTGPLPESLQGSANGENGRFHLYFPQAETNGGSQYPEYVTLDLDNVDIISNPDVPETTTIIQQLSGIYRYSVHDFTNEGNATSTALSRSNATVVVWKGSSLIQTYHVPSNISGTIWTVFELSGDVFTPINRFSNGFSEDAEKF